MKISPLYQNAVSRCYLIMNKHVKGLNSALAMLGLPPAIDTTYLIINRLLERSIYELTKISLVDQSRKNVKAPAIYKRLYV